MADQLKVWTLADEFAAASVRGASELFLSQLESSLSWDV